MPAKKRDATWLYETILLAAAAAIGFVFSNTVFEFVDVGFYGSVGIAVTGLAVYIWLIDKIVGTLNREYTRAEKVEREREKQDFLDNLSVR